MACREGTGVLLALLATLATLTGPACARALAQDDELAVQDERKPALRLADVLLSDGGTGICHQVAVIGNDCRDPNGSPTACCLFYAAPSPSQLQGPGCWAFAETIVNIQQVGKGYCCERFAPGYGPTDWVRFEDGTSPCDFCGGKTPQSNECCTRDRDIIPAYPVTDPSKCPDLQQDPDHQPSHTEPPCGNQDMIDKGWKIPQGFGPVSFYFACGNHDVCYSTCGSIKAVCDNNFKAQVSALCDAYYQQRMANVINEADPNIDVSYSHCITFGEVYYLGVTTAGSSSYFDAQTKVCRCCKGGPN